MNDLPKYFIKITDEHDRRYILCRGYYREYDNQFGNLIDFADWKRRPDVYDRVECRGISECFTWIGIACMLVDGDPNEVQAVKVREVTPRPPLPREVPSGY